jgi:hypothetical protein
MYHLQILPIQLGRKIKTVSIVDRNYTEHILNKISNLEQP